MDTKASENQLMLGMVGGFVLALVSIFEALPLFKVRLPGAVGLVVAILALIGYATIAMGFLGLHKANQKAPVQFAGFGFLLLALVALISLVLTLMKTMAVLYMLYVQPAVGALVFAIAGYAVSQSGDAFGKYGKIISSGFYAIAVVNLYLLLVLLVRSLGGRYVLYVSYAFIAAKLMAFVTAGLGFMEMRKRA